MRFAEKFRKPLITFIDTPGAYPGIGAEERGQGESIARTFMSCPCSKRRSSRWSWRRRERRRARPGVADRVLMLEHSTYSVISPEGCAAILWNNGSKANEAAELLKITAQDLFQMNVIDEVVEEPVGGAHRDPGGRGPAERSHRQEPVGNTGDPGGRTGCVEIRKIQKIGDI